LLDQTTMVHKDQQQQQLQLQKQLQQQQQLQRPMPDLSAYLYPTPLYLSILALTRASLYLPAKQLKL
jgi:hypothetical protein